MLESLANIGEFVGGIAVLVTLVYLTIQIRSNTAAIQSASRENVAKEYREIASLHLDTDVSKAFSEGLRYYPNLPYEKLSKFSTLMSTEGLFFQGVYARYEEGQLEEETFQAYLLWFSSLVSTPGGAAWFDEVARPIFMKRMIPVVDERVSKGDLPNLLEMPTYSWNGDSV